MTMGAHFAFERGVLDVSEVDRLNTEIDAGQGTVGDALINLWRVHFLRRIRECGGV